MKFLENHHAVNVGNSNFIAANEDIFDGDPATDVINLSHYGAALFVLQKGAGAVGTATITVESCDDVIPTTATAVAFKYRKQVAADTWGAWTAATAAGFVTTAGADQMYEICVEGKNLSGDDKYVRLKMTEAVDDPCDGSVIALLTEPRYSQSVPNSVLV